MTQKPFQTILVLAALCMLFAAANAHAQSATPEQFMTIRMGLVDVHKGPAYHAAVEELDSLRPEAKAELFEDWFMQSDSTEAVWVFNCLVNLPDYEPPAERIAQKVGQIPVEQRPAIAQALAVATIAGKHEGWLSCATLLLKHELQSTPATPAASLYAQAIANVGSADYHELQRKAAKRNPDLKGSWLAAATSGAMSDQLREDAQTLYEAQSRTDLKTVLAASLAKTSPEMAKAAKQNIEAFLDEFEDSTAMDIMPGMAALNDRNKLQRFTYFQRGLSSLAAIRLLDRKSADALAKRAAQAKNERIKPIGLLYFAARNPAALAEMFADVPQGDKQQIANLVFATQGDISMLPDDFAPGLEIERNADGSIALPSDYQAAQYALFATPE